MEKKNKKNIDFIDELSDMLDADQIKNAKKFAEKEIFKINLSEIRKKMGVKQNDIKSFTQSGISKLESRKDMKISTLIEYLKELDMGMEIIVYPLKEHKKENEIVIVKV
ncbi:MAG: XRE family transcriptional regulator [Clostridia bacterium]|nr:XRE family transcriptional regulator [Clostridia bacterium]